MGQQTWNGVRLITVRMNVGEEEVDEWRKKLKVVVGWKYRNFSNQNGEAFFLEGNLIVG